MKKLLIVSSFCVSLLADSLPLTLSDGASYQTNAGISPGAIVTLKGPNLSSVTMTAPDPTHPPLSLGGLTVTINDAPCQIYYISPTQVNAVVPLTATPGYAFVVLQSPARTAQTSTYINVPSETALFTANGTGSGDGAILNAHTYQEGPASVTSGGSPTYLALFGTSLDKTTTPTVWIGGIASPLVQYFGDQGQYPGMQQINVQVPPQLQGAGRVEVVVEQKGLRSNAVEQVLLPNQAVFPDDQPNTIRSREAAAVAWVPGTSLALVADENDDVVRVVDLSQKAVTHVIALPSGAEPAAIGVYQDGKQAVVAERGRGAIAYLDLTAYNVAQEYQVGIGPSAIAVALDQAVILNSDSDTVSFFQFKTPFLGPSVTANVPVGRLPRGVAVDSQNAYVTCESAGSVVAVSLANHTVTTTYDLGVDVRPASIRVLPDLGYSVIAEPSAGPGGKLIFLNMGNKQFTSVQANPANTGGASSMAQVGDQLYLANQSDGSVTTTPVNILASSQLSPASIKLTPTNFSAGLGTRSLDIDTKDNLLLMLNEGTGTVALQNLAANAAAGSIDVVRSSTNDTVDDHSDRLAASNMPTITSVSPTGMVGGEVGLSTTITITGKNLTNAEQILLIDPASVPGLAFGKGNVNRGNFGVSDPAFTISNIQANAAGTQVTAQLALASNTQVRSRVIRVVTPNGETSLTSAPTFSIVLQSN